MAAGKFDITIEQGATFILPLSFVNPTDNSQIDISTWTFVGEIKQTYSDVTPLASFTFGMVTNTNQITATIPATTTAMLPVNMANNFEVGPSYGCYDIIAELEDGTVNRLMEGSVSIIPGVTSV